MVVEARVFEGFAALNLILAISWFITSAKVFRRSKKSVQSLLNSILLKSWLINGYIVALVDVIFGILLIIDMIETTRLNDVLESSHIIPAIGLVFTIVTRGFTLWIINVSFLIYLSRRLWRPKILRTDEFDTSNDQPNENDEPVSHGSQSASSPVQQEEEGAGHSMNLIEIPATSITPYAAININPSTRRQSSPLLTVTPPYIPEPDYNLGPKTVLKNRSQYFTEIS